MGAYDKHSRYYSDIEVKLLKRYFDKMTIADLRIELFKNHSHARSETSIKAKLKSLGLSPVVQNFWTSQKLQLILDNFEIMTYKQIGLLLGKSEKSVSKAIRTHLPHLKRKSIPNMLFKNKDNLDKLKNNLHLSNYSLSQMFGCSYSSIVNAKTKYNLVFNDKNPYTKEEEKFIIDSYGKISKKDISKSLNRSYGSVCSKISHLVGNKKIKYTYSLSIWTEVDKEFLIDNYTKYTYLEFSRLLKKNIKSIGYMARKLNLRKENQIPWSYVETEYLKNNYSTTFTKDIAKALNRSYYSVQTKANNLGLLKINDGRFKLGDIK